MQQIYVAGVYENSYKNVKGCRGISDSRGSKRVRKEEHEN